MTTLSKCALRRNDVSSLHSLVTKDMKIRDNNFDIYVDGTTNLIGQCIAHSMLLDLSDKIAAKAYLIQDT